MNRRSFFKVVTGFVAGLFWPRTKVCMPSEQDNIYAELQKCADYATQEAPFIQYLDVWFFADSNIIKYCPVKELRWDNWTTISINYNPDAFDFWQKIDGKLFWCGEGEHDRWEILVNPDDNLMPVRIRWSGYWDGENWNNYK